MSFRRGGLEPIGGKNFGEHIYFWIPKWMHENFVRDSCIIDITVCASFFMWSYFLCNTPFCFSSYLEYSVWWLEFICLCAIHRFRYYMIFSAKVDMEFVFDALYWWVVSLSFPFHLDQLNDCNDVIILPLMNLMYPYLGYLYIVYDSIPNVYVIVSSKYINLWMLLLNLVLLNLYWEIPLWKKIPISS